VISRTFQVPEEATVKIQELLSTLKYTATRVTELHCPGMQSSVFKDFTAFMLLKASGLKKNVVTTTVTKVSLFRSTLLDSAASLV